MSLLHHDAKIERLRAIPLFADADRSALKHLSSAADEVTVAGGTVLIGQGHVHHEGYVIVAGSVAVDIDGTQVAEIGAGEMVGELGLFGDSSASATVTAIGEVRALVIPYSHFDQILDDNPALTKAIAINLASRLHAMDEAAHRRDGGADSTDEAR